MSAESIARALGGRREGRNYLCRCPVPSHGNGKGDRMPSLSIRDGNYVLLVHCFAGCEPLDVLGQLRDRGLLDAGAQKERRQAEQAAEQPNEDDAERIKRALEMWHQARDPRGTLVERYLHHRRVGLPHAGGEVVRFHPDCPFNGRDRTPCMIALIRNIASNAPQAIHRTPLNPDGTQQRTANGKTWRLSLGPIRGGAIKLTDDANVTSCLGVAEGVETALTMQLQPEFGRSPVWSLVSVGGYSWLPVLSGIESLWIAIDHDPIGQKRAATLARRWANEGRETFTLMSPIEGEDLNDVARRR
jgi:putative DNA primase/helicase